MESTSSLIRIPLYIVVVNIQKVLPVKNMELKHPKKGNEEPVYGKYRQIYAKKAMPVKRFPDIEYYKTNYEKWKKTKQFISEIKTGKKTYDEFDEWLDKN